MAVDANRPIVFVSSTIHDFRDLRSALKFWLQSMGFEVRMSDFNDFKRKPEEDAYRSCFHAIEGCHYYLLLVGSRKGSEYLPGVSVTQQEYRTAAELAKQGKIKTLIFVRQSALTALEQNEAHRKAGATEEVLNAASRALEEPHFVRGFLDEIAQSETNSAGGEASGPPWRYPFDEFEDIVEALRVNLRIARSITSRALLANLKWELEENLAVLIRKRQGFPMAAAGGLSPVRRRHTVTAAAITALVPLSLRQATYVMSFWSVELRSTLHLRDSALLEAINSGEFLSYVPEEHKLQQSPVSVAMQTLRERIAKHRSLIEQLADRVDREMQLMAAVQARQESIAVLGHDLAMLYGSEDVLSDVTKLSIALLRYAIDPLAGFHAPTLAPLTPLADQLEALTAEQATHDDVERWAKDGFLWRWLADERGATNEDVEAAMQQYPYFRELFDKAVNEDAERLRRLIDPDDFQRRAEQDGVEAALGWAREVLHQDEG